MRYINKNDLLIIARNMGLLMIGIGVMCLVPIIVDLIYLEFNAVSFLVPSSVSVFLGLICVNVLNKYAINEMRLKHAMIVSSLSWLWAGIVGGVIFQLVTGLNIVDGLFESMSALTGSGITIYPDVEALPHSILFFRGFQQWIGGLGIIVMIISVLTKPGRVSSKLYRSEARDDYIKPSTKATIKQFLKIYVIYTVFGITLYSLAGMPIFDSVCNTFSIISTGGMSVKNANIGFYNDEIIYFITIILMILGATSFVVHYNIIKTRGKSLIYDRQFQVMISLIAISTLLIYFTSQIVSMDILFVVVSAITTTGASIESSIVMGGWPPFAIFIIISLMLIGGSTGSTVGALKLMRVITFFKGIYKNSREIWSPEGSIVSVKVSNKKLTDDLAAQSGNFMTLYFLCILITWALLCLYGHDPFDSLFFTISMQGNVGLEIGQMSQALELPLKVIGIFNMWIGRLEIYPVLITMRAFFEIFKR
ncbi:MAG: TrkH family potassium uptake protein [Methanobrevibacter sp.]|uniref:TrkH family potassium uptake protein n=1 Tax=Methanobrevibacter sp. TaxID=66852 RepID=UPI0025D2E473|nr:TrkH family potassium uptake protein [Methanobrevibacter sp.]MBE6497719.1 TrkH family potassium uptake protein [Methanobrevibacter sp.]